MKAQKLIFALLSIALLFSCSDENSLGSNSEIAEANNLLAKQNALKYDNRISMEEAMKYVESATAFLNKEDNSELSLKRSIKSASKASSAESVSFLFFEKSKPSLLKSAKNANFDISDTLAYVFNFNDSLGSVIVAYDKRVENPLLAFTEKGFIGDKIDNPGLRIFLERAEDYILNSIIETEERKDSMSVVPLGWFSNLPKLSFDTVVGPFVSVQWGQNEPFNNALFSSDPQCAKYVTGCGATAVAQIMSYWKYPNNVNRLHINWNTLNKFKTKDDFYSSWGSLMARDSARTEVAKLFKKIGDGIHMQYGCHGSSSNMVNIVSFLDSNRFTATWEFTSGYNTATAKSYLSRNRPLIARACSGNNIENCHIWVMDGYATMYNVDTLALDYMHNNWGWDGNANGYYFFNAFNPPGYNFNQGIAIAYIRM